MILLHKSIGVLLVDTVRLDSHTHLPFHAVLYFFYVSHVSSMVTLLLFSSTIIHARHGCTRVPRAVAQQEHAATGAVWKLSWAAVCIRLPCPAMWPGFSFPESWQARDMLNSLTFCQWVMTESMHGEYPELCSLVYHEDVYVQNNCCKGCTQHMHLCVEVMCAISNLLQCNSTENHSLYLDFSHLFLSRLFPNLSLSTGYIYLRMCFQSLSCLWCLIIIKSLYPDSIL